MNYYSHHIGDFRSGSVNMTRQERWIYRDMIEIYYDTEQPLPLDSGLICNMLGVRSDEESKIVESHLRFKFKKSDDGYRHERCDEEILNYHKKAIIAQENGKNGGRPRKNNPQKPSGFLSGSDPVPIRNPEQTGSQANQEPITNNHKPLKTKTSPDDDLFAGIDDQIVIDYKKLRKAKNLPATKTAMEGVKREADLAGLSFADAIRLCCERGWAGFKAEWILQPNRAAPAMGIIGQTTKLTGVQHGNFGAQDYRAGIAEDGSF